MLCVVQIESVVALKSKILLTQTVFSFDATLYPIKNILFYDSSSFKSKSIELRIVTALNLRRFTSLLTDPHEPANEHAALTWPEPAD